MLPISLGAYLYLCPAGTPGATNVLETTRSDRGEWRETRFDMVTRAKVFNLGDLSDTGSLPFGARKETVRES